MSLTVAFLSLAAGLTPLEPLAASGPETVETRGGDQTLLQSAAEGLEKIKNLQARFTQVSPSGAMTTGTLYLARPGRLRFEFDQPNPTLIVATGGLVYVHDSDLETTDSYPVRQTPLRFLLKKELDLDAAQVLSVHENEHGLKITLAAKDEDLQGRLALVFDPKDLTLEGWSFVDPNGEVTLVDLDDVEEVKRLPGKLFRVPEAGGTFLRDN
ncbi:MAG: outer membrane lipoprotein carrier protein LolA [Parvularculaceae bacterium]|nr:outer membrane lipoprotein carrier protein LolA [Parvularculaceae bacterium]